MLPAPAACANSQRSAATVVAPQARYNRMPVSTFLPRARFSASSAGRIRDIARGLTLLACTAAFGGAFAREQPHPPTAHADMPMDMPPMDMPPMDMPSMDMPGMQHDRSETASMPMPGALGPYSMTREASGTAWQPDASMHHGMHASHGRWELMAHATLDAVYDRQGGPRGDSDTFLSGMLMGQARTDLDDGNVLRLRAMISPEPLMGARGYPLLLASGETADGAHPLVDRQHPHDLFMELSASFAHAFSPSNSVFGYVGLPGEPAFGPPAFMHRQAILDSPEAPISHHWLDSTHVAFGVVTLGVVHDRWKVEGSRFNGREPDQHRYDIETGALDSSALRVSWNPAPRWSLQASWARLHAPEQLASDENQTRWSASALYTRAFDAQRSFSVTAAWGRRISDGVGLDAWVLEASLNPAAAWTLFARAERTDNNELLSADGAHGAAHTVAKASVGVLRDFRVSAHATLGIGALFSINAVDDALASTYGSDPAGGMLFVRLKLD
jgi:hypothetical protein